MASDKETAIREFSEAFSQFAIDEIPGRAGAMAGAGASLKDFLGAITPLMEDIGKRFDTGELYLPHLVAAGEMFTRAGEVFEAAFPGEESENPLGALVLATPKGDIHNLGKDIFGVLAKASGFAVHDLGVDVAPGAMVDRLEETGAPILGLSALLTTTFDSIREVVRLLEERGLRDRVRVILGGGATEKSLVEKLGVDAQTRDAYEGLNLIRGWATPAEKEEVA